MTTRIPAVFARGGTSKGVIFHARDLPKDRAACDRILLRMMGSPDPFGRQLDGMGGGVSSLSKALIIAPSQRPDADVDYTFAQVSVDKPVVDYGSMCGNMSASVGPFAVEEGLVAVAADGEVVVRIYNTNTDKIVHARFAVRNGRAVETGDLVIPGVAEPGAMIKLDYLDPGGAATAALLPSARVIDELSTGDGRYIAASLVDATNPVVFLAAADLHLSGTELPDALEAMPGLMARLEKIRRAGAVAMGMVTDPEKAGLANPKIAIISPPARATALDGATLDPADHDLTMRMVSMERIHKAVTLTGAKCCACAVAIPGTIPHRLANQERSGNELRIANPSGVVPVAADVLRDSNGGYRAVSATSYRTQRRLMEGFVLVP